MKTRRVETDVLVVGAGPTGLTAANLLADQGLRVLLIERLPRLSDEPRAISITDESLRTLQPLGVLPQLVPEMLMDTGARYFGRKGQLLAEVRAVRPRLGQPARSQFDQPILARVLLEAARSRPQIDVRFATEAFGVVSQPGHVDAVLVDADGRFDVQARWVVACDGGRSPVRTQLGIPLEGSTQVQKWIVVDVCGSTVQAEPFIQFHCNGRRPAVVVPGAHGRVRFEFMLLPGETDAAVTAPEAIVGLVAPYQRIAPGDIRRAAVYVAQQRIALAYRTGRVLLAGDAAHLMPPFAGQGLNAGIRDVANLAWKVAAHVQGSGSEALIDSYALERRPHAEAMLRLSRRIGRVVMTTHPRAAAARDLGLAALGLVPPAKRWLVGMRFLKQPQFAQGCVLAPAATLPEAARGLVGRALSQPQVQAAGLGRVPLDAVLGSGWSLLRFDTAGATEVRRLSGAARPEPATVVTEASAAFADLQRSGLTVWVRPDRYVAAVSTAPEEAATARALGRYAPLLPAWLEAGRAASPLAAAGPRHTVAEDAGALRSVH